MATFQYEAMNSAGQVVKDAVDATSSEEAIQKIRTMGRFPTKIKERAGGGGHKSSAGGKAGAAAAAAASAGAKAPARRKVGKVSVKLLTQFTRQLSTLQDAGLPILRSLRILEEQQKPGMLRVAIRLVAEDVEAGSSLSEAMSRHPKAFDRLYTNMIRAGELGGVLDLILNRLADFMEKTEALKRKIKGAMIYPAAVIIFAVLIVAGLLYFVVPKFAKIFSDMDENLPGVTNALLGLSEGMVNGGWMWLIIIPVGFFVTTKLLRQSKGGAYVLDRTKLSLPIMGQIVGKTSIARFSRTLGTLLSAGVPILDALSITADTAGNAVYTRALKNVRDSIREGESMAKPLRQARVVDAMVVNMIDVGEETGELDKMLEKVADTYDEEVEVLVSGMVSLLEPVMVITLGLIVGFIVIALFMPMVSLLNAVSSGA
ncbi:MAG: type II secretion system F family protein [Planctomycetes bacterium]|jgi:type IV pilus assembly protein PilC|nr:type II secretion system F family protein [Planctomycetota bacterium]